MRKSAKRFLSVLLTVAMVSQTLAPATEAFASSVTNGDEAAATTVEKQAPAEDTEATESETKSQDQPQGQATTPDSPTTTTTTTQAKPSPDSSTASGLAPPIDVTVNDNDKADVRDEAKDMSSEVEEDAAATLLSSKVAKRTPARLLAAATSATAAAPDVTSADGNSIDALTVGWVTKDTTDDGNAANLLLVPKDNSKVSAVAEIDFSLSGEHDYAAGTLQVKIPAHVFSKRDGSAYGTTVIPYASSPSTKTEFNWALVGDNYVLTNTRTLSAATAASIQIGFENLTPSEVHDMATSEPFSAQVLVTTAMNHQITRHSNQITAQIDTHETVTAATKDHPTYNFFDILTAAQMKAKGYTIPAEYAGETRFVVAHWYTYGYHEGNTLYSMDWSDAPESKGAYKCFAVSPTSGNSTKDSWSENSQTGYVYVDVAYPLSQFKADTNYTLTNDATWTCTETDDGSVTSKSASATMPFSWSAPKSVIPKGHFYSQKWGEDDDTDRTTHYDAYGTTYSTPGKNGNWLDLYSPYGTYETVANDLANGKDSRLNYGQYIRGYVLPFTRVGTDNDKLSNFGGSDVTMTLTDGEDGLTYATSGKSVHLTGAGSYEFSSLHLIRPDVYKAVEFDGSDVSPSEIIRDSDEQVYLGSDETAKGNTYGVGYVHDRVAADCPSFKVEAKVNGTWKTVTTVDWTAEGDTRDVAMPAGTTAYRVSVTIGKSTPTKDGTSFIAAVGDALVEPIVTLHATDDVRAVAKKALDEQDMPVTTLENSQVFVATQNGSNLLTLTDAAVDYIYGITDDVSVVPSKTGVATVDYDEAAFKVHYSADVREQTNARSVASYDEAVTKGILTSDTSGTFYDLLPVGVTPDLSTVRVGHTTYSGTSNHTHFDSTTGTVTNAYTIANWRGTGRTMLVVNASLTPTPALYYVNGTTQLIADTPHIEFDASYTFDAFNDRSSKATATIHNVIAYESGNATLGNVANFAGEPDNPAAGRNTVSSTAFENDAEKTAMTDLDKRTDKPAFVYAGTTTMLMRLSAATSELTKQVEVNNDGTFGTGVTGSAEHKGTDDQERTVYVGGSYRYRLSDSAATDLKGVVLYDNLEDYVPTSDKADYQDTTWKGTLASVDTSALEAKGVKPTVYYSTEPVGIASAGNDSLLSADGALTSGKWHVLTDNTDLSTVKAIAIDCSKATDGSDYTLAKGDSLTAFVSMRAPSGDAALAAIPTADGGTSTDADGAHAYNNVFVNATAVATGVTQLVRKDYTKVGLKPYTLKVTKAWADHDDNDGVRPKSVTVHLYDVTDDRDTGKTVTLSADNNWTGTFTGLTATADDGSQAVYSFTEEGAPGYSLTSARQTDGTVSLTNHHTLAITSISGTKTWVGGASHPSSVTIQAYDVDDPSVTVASTVASGNGDTWDWSIKGLPKYKDHGKTVTYAVREVRTSDTADFAATVDGTSIINTYHPKGDLRIDKKTENTTAAADGQTFTMRVLLTAADGSDFVEKVPYRVLGKDGSVVSSGTYVNNSDFELEAGQSMVLAELPKGTRYAVTEDRASGYTASWADRTGTIASNVVTDVTCDNVYAATGTASVVATKSLTGRTLRANEFTYVLTDADGNVVARGYNDADGKVALGALTYHVADAGKTFTYTLSEGANSDHRVGYTYDRTTYTVTVKPHDNGDGTMTCDVTYADKDGKAIETPSFANDFKSIGQASLTAYKQQLSGELKGDDYTFQLYDEDGSKLYLDDNGHPTTTATDRPIQAKNDADGTIRFPAMTYTQDDLRNADGTYSSKTLTYAAREVVPDGAKLGDDGYYTVDGDTTKYSSQTFYWHVVLSDDGADTYGKAAPETKGKNAAFRINDTVILPASKSTDITDGYGIITLVDYVYVTMPNGMVYEYHSATDSTDTIVAAVKASIRDHTMLNKYFVSVSQANDTILSMSPDDASDEDSLSAIYGADEAGDNAFMGPAQLQVDTVRVDKDGKETDTMPLFVNAKKPGTLTVEKLTTGDVSDADPNQEFTFKVKITTPDGTSVPDDLGETLHRSSKSSSVAIDGSSDIDDAQALTLSITAPVDSTATTVTINGSADPSDATTVTTVPGTAVTTTVHVKAGSHVSVLGLPEGSTYDVSSNAVDVTNGSGTTAANQISTVTASKRSIAYAVLNQTTGELDFVRSTETHANGDTGTVKSISGGTYTGTIYAGFESATYSYVYSAPWHSASSQVKSVRFVDAVRPTSTTWWFYEMNHCTTMDLSRLDTSQVTDMGNMFCNCSSLISLDVSGFDTSQVTYMSGMFDGCSSLTSLDVSHFDTRKVTGMSYMFRNCSSLTSLDVSGFDTSQVGYMADMFYKCSSLASLDVSSFDTSQVMNISGMFSHCESLTSLDVSGFDTSKVTRMAYMFKGCSSLTSIMASSKFVTTALTDSGNTMFDGCSALVGGNGTRWSARNVDATYARIDTASTPGYFTEKASAKSKASVPNTGSDGTAPSARRLVNTGTTSHSNMFPRPTKTESGKPSTGKWGLGSENAATSYSADELPDHITAGTWYAQAQTYAVSFDANGGSGSMATKNVDSLTLPKPTFYRLGYTPTGWNTAADGKGTHYDVGATFTPTAATTLYAEWTKDTNVTKNDDGTYTVTLKAGEAIDLSGLPAGSTYEVVESSVPGWTLTGSTNANGTIEADQDMTATFTNAYTPGQTSATISATKTMDGTIPTDTYGFELKDSEGKVLQTVSNDGSSVAFAPIAYASAGTYTYTIDEVAGSDETVSYDSHVETVTVTVTDDSHGNLSAAVAYDSDGASFANTSKPGSLAIRKYVNDGAYADKLFDATVSLTDASGKELTGTYTWICESGRSGTISSGGTVSVSENDPVAITGLPAGTRYTVSEPSVPAGWTNTTGSESGTISANGLSYAVIHNTYSASGSLALKAKKTFDGTLEAGQFSFTATVTDPKGKPTTTSATNDANGDISFSPVALTQPGTYKLSIAEDAGNDADVTYDTKTWTATATVTDDGEGHLVASVSDWSDGSTTAKVPTFANTVAKTDLEISKTVSTKSAAAKSDAAFDFVVTLPSGSYSWTSTDGTSGTVSNGGTVTLSDGETLTIKGLPVGSDYSVREVASANYSQTSAKGASGTLRSGTVAKVSFTNAYQATGSVTLGLDKTLTDDTLTAGEFGFELYGQGTSGSESEASGTAVPDGYSLIDTATNDADGKVTFGTIDYDASDLDGKASVTKTYVIREMGGGSTANGIAYDGSLVYAHVTLTDDGAGSIATSVSYTDAKGATLSSPGFTNRRTTASGAATISVTKSLKDDSGKALADWGGRTFEAVLTDADGNQLDTVTLSQETPMAAFDRLDYTLDSLANDDGTHDRTRVFTYYVTETAGTDQAVTYDTAKHKVQVTVTNEGSGQLSTAVAYDDGTTAVLENRLTELDLKVTKVDDANKPLKGATFALYEDDGETLDTAGATPVATGTTDADGHVTFSKAISSKGRYWLVETASPDGYILASPYVIEPGSGNEATVLRTTTAGTVSTLGDSIGTIKASDGAYSVTITDSGVGSMPASGVRPVSLTLAAAALIALAISLAVWRRRWARRHGEM